jgi:D-serine deaminase-like pyridoxal phosphate-dependent protein
VLRSGCYLTHDSGYYAARSPLDGAALAGAERLRPALELWGAVLSRPEPGLAVVGFGKRDAPYDLSLPTPERVRRSGPDGRPVLTPVDPGELTVTALNDQHALVAVGDVPLAVGDWIGCGISHPCTAFDKWRLVPVVEDDGTVLEAVETCF